MYVYMDGWIDGRMQALPIWKKITRVVIAQLSIAVFIQNVWCYLLALEALSTSPSGRNHNLSIFVTIVVVIIVVIIVIVIVSITYVPYDVCMYVCAQGLVDKDGHGGRRRELPPAETRGQTDQRLPRFKR